MAIATPSALSHRALRLSPSQVPPVLRFSPSPPPIRELPSPPTPTLTALDDLTLMPHGAPLDALDDLRDPTAGPDTRAVPPPTASRAQVQEFLAHRFYHAAGMRWATALEAAARLPVDGRGLHGANREDLARLYDAPHGRALFDDVARAQRPASASTASRI